MTKRDPLRFRKSETGRRRHQQRSHTEEAALPRPGTDRQLAFSILDEHRRTGAFVGQLLEAKLEGLGRSYSGKSPLAGRVRTHRTTDEPGSAPESGSMIAAAPGSPEAEPPDSRSAVAGSPGVSREASRKAQRFDRRFVSEMVNGVVRRESTLDALLAAFVTRPRYSIEDQLWLLLRLGVYQLIFMRSVPEHAAVHETVNLARWAQQPRWCGFINGVLRTIAREVDRSYFEEPSSSRVPVSVRQEGTRQGGTRHEEARQEEARQEATRQQGTSEQGPDEHGTNEQGPGEHGTSEQGPNEGAASSERRLSPAGESAPHRMATAIQFREIGRDVFPPPETSLPEYVSTAFGLPEWLMARWSDRFSDSELLDMAKWFELRQPLTLRVNRLRTSRDELLTAIREATGHDPLALVEPGSRPESILYDGPLRIVDLPGFADGHFTVQDETAMSAVGLLAPEPGQRVLDLCAAPGTKTTHLAELMQGEGRIVATDIDLHRLRRVEENADRLGFSIIEPVVLREDLSELPTGPFEAVLIDVPCSNTGVLGKRPEVRSRITPGDVEELSGIQLRLLEAAAPLPCPGGRIVYSTCSIEPEENFGVVARFLESHSEYELVEVREFLPGKPSDGGYQALLVRRS